MYFSSFVIVLCLVFVLIPFVHFSIAFILAGRCALIAILMWLFIMVLRVGLQCDLTCTLQTQQVQAYSLYRVMVLVYTDTLNHLTCCPLQTQQV